MKPDFVINWRDIANDKYAVIKKDHVFQTVKLDPETEEIIQVIYYSGGEEWNQYKYAYDIFINLVKE